MQLGTRRREAQKLRCPAHGFVTKTTTVDVMSYIFGAGYRGEKEVPWPGLDLRLDSDVFTSVDGGYDYSMTLLDEYCPSPAKHAL
ncbi:MAG: hypothetical protein Q9226_008171 [Calogaya cf. arnoldii]